VPCRCRARGCPCPCPHFPGGGMVISEDRDVGNGLWEGTHMQGYPCSPPVTAQVWPSRAETKQDQGMVVDTVHNWLHWLINSTLLGMGNGGASSGGSARVPENVHWSLLPAPGASLCMGKQRAGEWFCQQNKARGSSEPHLRCSFRSLLLHPACTYPIRSERESRASRALSFWCRIVSKPLKEW